MENLIGHGPNGTNVVIGTGYPEVVALKWIPQQHFQVPPNTMAVYTSCNHENIVKIHEFSQQEGFVCQMMEKCDMNLATYIAINQDRLINMNGRPTSDLMSIIRYGCYNFQNLNWLQ